MEFLQNLKIVSCAQSSMVVGFPCKLSGRGGWGNNCFYKSEEGANRRGWGGVHRNSAKNGKYTGGPHIKLQDEEKIMF